MLKTHTVKKSIAPLSKTIVTDYSHINKMYGVSKGEKWQRQEQGRDEEHGYGGREGLSAERHWCRGLGR